MSLRFFYHGDAINFIPHPLTIFAQVALVLQRRDRRRYLCRSELAFEDAALLPRSVTESREFRHTLSTMSNGLVQHGFQLVGCREETTAEANPKPGSWEHYKGMTAWILNLWTVYRPQP